MGEIDVSAEAKAEAEAEAKQRVKVYMKNKDDLKVNWGFVRYFCCLDEKLVGEIDGSADANRG